MGNRNCYCIPIDYDDYNEMMRRRKQKRRRRSRKRRRGRRKRRYKVFEGSYSTWL